MKIIKLSPVSTLWNFNGFLLAFKTSESDYSIGFSGLQTQPRHPKRHELLRPRGKLGPHAALRCLWRYGAVGEKDDISDIFGSFRALS